MVLKILLPLIGALALGAGTVWEKLILKERKVSAKLFQTSVFLALILIMIPFIYFFWKLDPAALEMRNVLIMLGIVISAVIANVLILYALKWDKITHITPARLVEPLIVIFLAILFSFIFGETLFERNTKVIIPAVIAGVALIFSHIKKHHLSFNKYFIATLVGSFFFALEMVSSRLILDFYTPLSFYFIRSLLILTISFLIFKPQFDKLSNKIRWEILGVAAIFVGFRMILYYGYLNYGVIFTTLMIMLGPVFIYYFAWKFLKEKIGWRNITAAAIILGSVLYVILG